MKKVTNQKVSLSKTAKKILAGVLAASMIFGGAMTAFPQKSSVANASSSVANANEIEILEMNDDVNNSRITTDGAIELGAPAEEGAKGVLVTNPFAGKSELVETPQEAFANNGVAFNGLTYVKSGATYRTVATYSKNFAGFSFNSGKKWWQFGDGDSKISLVTKADAVSAYETAKKYLEENDIVGASGQAAELLATIAACTDGSVKWQNDALKAYAEKLAAVTDAAAIPADVVHWNYNGPARGHGAIQDPNTLEGEITYPMPKWNTGVTVSTWVKVPETATWSAPIFSFVDGDDGLVLRTDGNLIFVGNAVKNSDEQNYYSAKYTGATPFVNKGEWVYVTLTIKNDEFNVYYNGVKATEKTIGDIAHGKKGGKTFNYGFRFANIGDRLKGLLQNESTCYVDLLQNFGLEDTDYSNFNKYWTMASKSVMELVTDEYTELYIGGDDGTAICNTKFKVMDGDKRTVSPSVEKLENWWSDAKNAMHWAGYSEECEGMQVGELTFHEFPAYAGDAYQIYRLALAGDDAGEVTPNPEPTESATPEPTESTEPAPTASTEPAPSDSAAPAPSDSATPVPSDSAAPAPTGSAAPVPTGSAAPVPTGSAAPVPTGSAAPVPTGSVAPAPTGSVAPAPTGSVAPAPTGSVAPAPSYTVGDVDNNGKVELADAQLALKAALKITTLDENAKKAADVDNNGKVELADAQKILKVALKIDKGF